jgi:hypothetical protein
MSVAAWRVKRLQTNRAGEKRKPRVVYIAPQNRIHFRDLGCFYDGDVIRLPPWEIESVVIPE